VPKKKENYVTLLLQPFKTSCPGSDFAKSFVPGSAGQFVSPVPAWGEGSRLHIRPVPAQWCTGTLWD